VRFVVLVIVLLVTGTTHSQIVNQNVPPVTGKAKAGDKKSEQSEQKQEVTINLPTAINVMVGEKADVVTEKKKSSADQEPSEWTHPLTWLTLVLAAANVLLWLTTKRIANEAKASSKTANDSIELARKEFISTHRPKLHVRNIDIHRTRIGDKVTGQSSERLPLFAPTHYVSGQFYISNIGDTLAKIKEIGCWVEWKQDGLPMSRPYEEKAGNVGITGEINPGGSLTVPFMSTELMGEMGNAIREGGDNWHIYVMGWVDYFDELKTRRRTAFCREYRTSKDRFFPVKDPDYEHEE
jgi:hypothetical protein